MASLYVQEKNPNRLYLTLPSEEVRKSNQDAVNLSRMLREPTRLVNGGPRLFLGVK